ncbi:SHOCT domain-containing protein [Curvibacter sp. APW13]|uniref:SHOCT domain-containing protein n=1 Tax=Curvibacter sp. APW13 TaxID=3077236 RepID=UPI0028DDD680|nr:SHOCT domain-containing protein [Curvibacter sp. APW13]MDT8991439.1 SHOCT domain-containing protein [Curvibacter sp. APW13]
MTKLSALASVLAFTTSWAQAQDYSPHMWGYGWGMHGFMHILWWALAACVVVWLLRRPHGGHCGHRQSEDRALAILRERYARGEIDKTEFEARKRDLSN